MKLNRSKDDGVFWVDNNMEQVDAFGNPIAFMGNPNIKRKGTVQGFEKWQIDELLKCEADIIYFAEKYFKIITLDEGLTSIKLRDYQLEGLRMFQNNRFNAFLWSRQSGKCFFSSSINIRNKKTGEIKKIKIEDFFDSLKKESYICNGEKHEGNL